MKDYFRMHLQKSIGTSQDNKNEKAGIRYPMTGEEPSSQMLQRHRLRRRCESIPVQFTYSCFPYAGGFFICPESRGQAVTQGGQETR